MENVNRKSHLRDRDLVVLSADNVAVSLAGQERAVMDVVSKAYSVHGGGGSCLPHSSFLRFPDDASNRIIALPAYLGGAVDTCGVKWIASFPANVKDGIDRASAVLILNSTKNGQPRALLESSMISAWRTAASAALATKLLTREHTPIVGLIGCGVINFAILQFLQVACPGLKSVLIYDLNDVSERAFKDRCRQEFAGLKVEVVDDYETALRMSDVISFATTAGTPYIKSLSMCKPNAVVLHISLRDLMPQVILQSDNIVDDPDHVCRAQTSIHLTEQEVGHREFIRCTLADIINNGSARSEQGKPIVFSPFGLGVLDIAVGEFVLDVALQKGIGCIVSLFLPKPWQRSDAILAR